MMLDARFECNLLFTCRRAVQPVSLAAARWQQPRGLPCAVGRGRRRCRRSSCCFRGGRRATRAAETELKFFAAHAPGPLLVPRLRDAALRPLLAAPGHHLAAAAHARPAAAARARHRARAHPPTALQRLPPRTFIDAHALSLAAGEELDLESFRTAADGCRLRQRPTGWYTGRVRDARLAVRYFPDGQRRAAAHRPVRRPRSKHSQFRSRRRNAPAGRLDSGRAAAGARVPSVRPTRSAISGAVSARASRATRADAVYRDVGDGLAPRASSTTCRSSSSPDLDALRLSARRQRARAAGERRRRARGGGAAIEERYEERRHDIERPVLAPAECSCAAGVARTALAAGRDVELGRSTTPSRIERDSPRSRTSRPATPPELRIDLARARTASTRFATALRATRGARPARRRIAWPPRAAARHAAPARHRDRSRRGLGRVSRQRACSSAVAVAPLVSGVMLADPPIAIIRGTAALRRTRPPGAPPPTRDRDPGRDHPRPHRPAPGRAGRARGIRRRPLPRPAPWTSAAMTASSWCSNTRAATSCTCRCRRCTSSARYTGAPARNRAAAQARHRSMGEGAQARRRADPRRRRRAARPVRAARGARRAARSPSTRTQLPGLRSSVPVRGNRRPGRGHRRQVLADLRSRTADGSRGLRRRRLRQDRGRAARRVRRRRRRASRSPCSCRPRCSPSSITRPSPTASPTGRCGSRSCRASAPARKRTRDRSKGSSRARSTSSSARTACCSADVRFKDLGLLIVDEEHRFGVRDKERLKQLRAEVDVLTLTATPIPRTLNMALGGLRDLSLIDDAARGAARDQDLRHGVERADAARSLPARAPPRRAGLLRAQRVETIEKTAEQLAPAGARGDDRASVTARCASATSSSSCSISITGASTCWSARRSSRAASTSRPRTPS